MTLTVTAVVAPLLLLLGLKAGVIGAMQRRLLTDPRLLEVNIVGEQTLTRAWLDWLSARPEVAGVVPRTRGIDPTIDLAGPSGTLAPLVQMIVTGPGDPVLPPGAAAPASPGEVWLSAPLAARLAAPPGSAVTGVVRRQRDRRSEAATLPLRVAGVLAPVVEGREAVLVTLDLALATEGYRAWTHDLDGATVPAAGAAAVPASFSSARVYAAGLRAVAPLEALLTDQGLRVQAQSARIDVLLDLDRDLSGLLAAVALLAAAGAGLAVAALLWMEVGQQRRDLACLRLYGFPAGSVAAVVLLQMVWIGLAGFILAGALYLARAALFNRVLEVSVPHSPYRCGLDGPSLALTLAGTLLTCLAAAAAGAWRAAGVAPAEALRRG